MEQVLSDTALAELAVRENFLSREELAACLEAQRLSAAPRPLSEVMLEMQLITSTQLDRLASISHQASTAATAAKAPPATIAELFGRLAVEKGYLTPAQVDECLNEQRALGDAGQKMRLGQLMIKKRYITTDQFLEILKLQEKYILSCPSCESKYFAGDLGRPLAGGVLKCKKCGALLPSPSVVQELTKPPTSHTPRSGTRVTRAVDDTRAATIKVASPRSELRDAPADAQAFGKYRLIEQIGKGGMGVVWKALDTQLHRIVALKMLKEGDADGQIVQRFLREAKTAAQLNHPGIVTIHEVGTHDEAHYFTMEYVEGTSLDRLLAQKKISRDEALALLEKVSRAVDYAHSQGVVHRDLKPGNIMVDRMGGPHITDFGLAKQLGPATNLTEEGTAIGTPFYMSPEQVRGDLDEIDARSDVYAIGVMLYEVLVGDIPFSGQTTNEVYQRILTEEAPRPRQRRPDVPSELETIAMKAMEKDKLLRYATAGELADDLRRYLDGEPIVAKPISVVTRVAKRIRRNKTITLAVAASILFFGGGSVFGVKWWVEHRKSKDRQAAQERREKAKVHFDPADQAYVQATKLLYQPKASPAEIRKLLDEAIAGLGKAIEIDPQYAEAHDLRGRMGFLLGRFDEAEKDFDAAIRIDGSNVAYQFDRGKLLLVMVELVRGRPLIIVGQNGEPLAFCEKESSLAESTRVKMHEAFTKFLAGKGSATEVSLASAGVAFAENKFELAAERAGEVLRDEPRNEVALRLRGLSWYGAKKFKKAYDDFDAAIQFRSNLAEAGDLYGLTIFSKGEIDWSLGAHTRAIDAGPTPELLMNRGVLKMALKDPSGAKADFESALSGRPNDPEATLRMLNLMLAQKDTAKILEPLNAVIAARPDLAEAYRLRAAILLLLGDAKGAEADANKALQTLTDDPTAYYVRGRARLALGEYDAAMRDASQAVNAERSFYQAYELRAAAKVEARDWLGARDDVVKAIELRPDYAPAYVTSGRVKSNQRDPDGALKEFDKALQHDKKCIEAYLFRGIAHMDKNNLEAAIEDFNKGLKIDDKAVMCLVYRGVAHARGNNIEEGMKDLNDAATKFPKVADVFMWRGLIYEAIGDLPKALEDFNKAMELAPSRRTQLRALVQRVQQKLNEPAWVVHFKKAQEYIQATDYPKAKVEYEKGVKQLPKEMPESPEQRYWLLLGSYNYACVLAVDAKAAKDDEKKKLIDQSLFWLGKSCELGFREGRDQCHKDGLEHMKSDTDFEALKDDPRFKKLLKMSDE